MTVTVTKTGPLFDGRAKEALKEYSDELEQKLADRADELVHVGFETHFKERTGAYESRVTVENSAGGREVTDHGSVYGPWLEGTGSRNATTSFHGYHIFEETFAKVDAEAEEIGDRLLSEKYMRRIE